MNASRDDDSAVLNEFLRIFLADVEVGRACALADYQKLFPGQEALIAREFERLARKASERPSIAPPGFAESGASSEFLKKLAELTPVKPRYQLRGEVARGGMGAILKVWDESLRRNLAMKVVLGREDPLSKGSTPAVDENTLGRFLEEAQVTGQLDHPGVVPVHELGVSEERGVYFTMKLVKGEDLRAVFEKVRAGKEGWTQTRALSVLLKVCEAMAYAHDKKVVHRDLKPSNVMVGKYGEVYVMDWGLAKVIGAEDRHDLRLDPKMTTPVRSQRSEQAADSPLITMDGTVVGTPCYMSLEQAEGRLEELGPRSDVYAMGALLYELLTGQAPYVRPGSRPSPHSILGALLQGPPTPVRELAPKAPAELEAICEKAMSRSINERYRDMGELGADLAAYIEGRVVRAYETGAVAELRKWIERNKSLATAAAAAVLLLVVGLTASLAFKARSDRNAKLAAENASQAKANAEESARNARTAQENEQRALESQREVKARADDVLRLSDLQDLDDLTQQADELWPAAPELLPRYEAWLREAQRLVDKLPAHEAKLEELRLRGIEQGQVEIDATLPGPPEGLSSQDKWWHNQLEKLVHRLKDFSDPDTGLVSGGTSPEHGWGIEKRAHYARTIVERSVSGPEAAARWAEAITSIADVAEHPQYDGLRISPQVGLLPIGPDPASGLWEFAHLQTGEPAERGANGQLVFTEQIGLVLVLLPGGTFLMGAQASDTIGRNYDPHAAEFEGPVHEVALSPFFLSKYEMSQAQWLRFTGHNPSNRRPGNLGSLLNPVEQVNWNECGEVCRRLELELPSEAQWEYGARGSTSSPWWTGEDRSLLFGAGNLLDDAAARMGMTKGMKDWQEVDDGYATPAPVNLYEPNAFGLHNVHGNVCEWCLDGLNNDFYGQGSKKDPVADPDKSPFRCYRGGSFGSQAASARSAWRAAMMPTEAGMGIGLRPAKTVWHDQEEQRGRNQKALEALQRTLAEEYSYYDLRVKDWERLFNQAKPGLLAAKTDAAWASAAARLLKPANDIHMYLRLGERFYAVGTRAIDSLYRRNVVEYYVKVKPAGNEQALYGRTDDAIGYLMIAQWNETLDFDCIERALGELRACKAMVVDARPNSGGDELLAQRVAAWFVDGTKTYAKNRYRERAGKDGFGPVLERKITGNVEARKRYEGPLAVLISRKVVSSNESFVMMLQQAKDCTLVGQPTFGSSGNPKPHDLGNGVTLVLPSWQDLRIDGSCIEGVGIAPDVLVEVDEELLASKDPILEQALALLRKKVAK